MNEKKDMWSSKQVEISSKEMPHKNKFYSIE